MAELAGDSTVSFTVKELFDKQNQILHSIERSVDGKADKADLARLSAKLDSKADSSAVSALGATVDSVRDRVKTVEDDRVALIAVAEARSKARRLVAWVVSGIAIPLTTACILVFVH